MSIRSWLLVFIAGCVGMSGCSHDPSAPVSAILEVRLDTPAQDDGAALFTILGGPVDSVEAPGYALYTARINESTTRVIVAGALTGGAIARVHLPDERQVPQYSVTLDQVAARGYAQRDVAGYTLTLGR